LKLAEAPDTDRQSYIFIQKVSDPQALVWSNRCTSRLIIDSAQQHARLEMPYQRKAFVF
jgi:hypothetical protein